MNLVANFVPLILSRGGRVRRWMAVAALGGAALTFAIAYAIRGVAAVALPDLLPGWWEAFPLVVIGATVIAVAAAQLVRRLGAAAAGARPEESLAESASRIQRQARGPGIVALGGGTGLATLLRGVKEVTSNVTGIVTVTDDGGSSGRLREELGVPPPGDIRNCIVALAEAEPMMKELFQYRFAEGSLKGHSFGNLFIAAMTGLTGRFETAVSEFSRVLKVSGTIMPSTLANLHVVAEMENGQVVHGESNIPRSDQRVRRVWLTVPAPEAYAPALEAIRQAELIVLGPGSLYTSIIPNLLVPDIAAAVSAAAAPVVYVCNIATQPGETHGYSVADHMQALRRHCPGLRVDYVLSNSKVLPLGPLFPLSHLVTRGDISSEAATIVERDLMNDGFRGHHDPDKLATALQDIYHMTRSRSPVPFAKVRRRRKVVSAGASAGTSR